MKIIMNLKEINKRIENTCCDKIIQSLTDLNLCDEFKEQKSTKIKNKKLETVLLNNNIEKEIINKITSEFILDLIPPGTKGIIRGLKFNELIKNQLNDYFNQYKNIVYEFEKKPKNIKTDEIPDFYVLNKTNNKIVIGYNQIDITGGGAQMNRGNKYIMRNESSIDVKYLSVVCNKVIIKSQKGKKFDLYSKGFSENILCYPKELNVIIKEFLELE